MKTTQLFTIGALVFTAAAQTIDSLPPCGKLCVNNMLLKASELGCASGDVACLCKNVNFAYGIRDCSTAACGAEAAAPVIAYGEKYCGSGGSSGNTPNSSSSAATTIGGSPSGPTASAIVATITSGTQVFTSTLGFTTLSSTEAIPSSASSLTSSIGSSASSAIASLSSQLSSVSSQASSASESATSTSSSSGAHRTAIAGLAAAAGLAGLVL